MNSSTSLKLAVHFPFLLTVTKLAESGARRPSKALAEFRQVVSFYKAKYFFNVWRGKESILIITQKTPPASFIDYKSSLISASPQHNINNASLIPFSGVLTWCCGLGKTKLPRKGSWHSSCRSFDSQFRQNLYFHRSLSHRTIIAQNCSVLIIFPPISLTSWQKKKK